MQRWRKLSEAVIQALLRSFQTLAGLKACAHHKCIGWLISELLVLDDISTAG
jgi:hypothetical protein